MFINGILLLYHYPLVIPDANTIMEHVNSFEKYSRYKIYNYNVEMGFPSFLKRYEFKIILLHYSLFGFFPYRLNEKFYDYLGRSENSYKIAFFQDENCYCQPRFNFINEYKIDCIYTCLRPENYKDVYLKYTKVPKLIYNLTGYVSEGLISRARQVTKPDSQREIDVGYRGRQLPWYMGKGALEKTDIAAGFLEHAAGQGLKLDIETQELKRIYGGAWLEFIANCRAVLGVEAGVSIFDFDDTVQTEYKRLTSLNPNITLKDLPDNFLDKWENNIFYRTISPRHFEAAALRTCQILFEGDYSGIMKPMVHYIPLKKDFSNFDEVMRNFRNKELRDYLTENAYRDLIHSGRYTYENFIGNFDEELIASGLTQHHQLVADITYRLDIKMSSTYSCIIQKFKALCWALWIKFCNMRQFFPGKRFLYPVVKPILRKLDKRWWGNEN